MKKGIEILAPAGSYESLKAAVSAGADAVYTGGSRFGARAYADNLSEQELLEAIDYVHLHGRKIYLTVNTLLKEKELRGELYDYLLPYYRQGIDAVIVQDAGVLRFIRKHFPELPVHASTQMTITNVSGAKFMEEQGVERVVTSRELSLEEIREISEQTDVEIESFVHGALCYCYSGQCLYSSMLGGRSGNRGQCAQPCRLPYKVNGKTSYVMSLKDLCTLDILPELAEAGIYSFKIEGRMKKPEYVAAVTSIYRRYADLYLEKGKKGYVVSKRDKEILMDLYNRGGFHSGYYKTRNGREMLSLERPNHAGVKAVQAGRQKGRELDARALVELHKGDIIELSGQENYTLGQDVAKGRTFSMLLRNKTAVLNGTVLARTRNEALLRELRETFVEKKVQEKMNGKLVLAAGEPSRLLLSCGGIEVQVEGEPAQEALNMPVDEARIGKQMRKTGNTAFVFDRLDIELHGSLFVPVQMLNELRRKGTEALGHALCESYRREEACPPAEETECRKSGCTRTESGFCVYAEKREQFDVLLGFESVKRIYIDCSMIPHAWDSEELRKMSEQAGAHGKELYFAMPYIFRKETKARYQNFFADFPFDGVLVRNYESCQFLAEHAPDIRVVLDHNLYEFNSEMRKFWKDRKIERFTAPLELNYRELKDVGCGESELIVYGYLQMMVSAQCIQKTTGGCTHRQGYLKMTDRYHKEFTVKNCCDYCYNVIYNTEPLCLLDQKREIEEIAPLALRLHFTLEDGEKTAQVMKAFEQAWIKGEKTALPDEAFTRGHFKRGIK